MLPTWRPALVVDDCRSAAQIMGEILVRIGFSDVKVVHSAEDGLLELRRRRHAFALVDIEMTPVDGLEMLDLIRSDESIRDVPVVLTTASRAVTLSTVRPACRIAPTSFILKPFAVADLKRKLSEMLESPLPKEDLLPSEAAKRFQEWAPSGRRQELESTLITRINRVQFS